MTDGRLTMVVITRDRRGGRLRTLARLTALPEAVGFTRAGRGKPATPCG